LTTNETKLLLCKRLQAVLASNGVLPENYSPAYDGESVGLDLYNVGERIIIPPVGKLRNFAELEADPEKPNPSTWLDFPEGARSAIFKRLVPTGVKAIIPRGYGGFIYERGSVIKSPLKVRAGVIDPGYTGEIFVNMINVSDVPYVLEAGEKTPFQLVIQKVTTNFTVIDAEEFITLTSTSLRQENQVGSSDK
jgi:dUTPase